MGEVSFQVPGWLEGLGHLPTTLPGLAMFLAPYALDYFVPGSAPLVSKVIAAIGGVGLALSTGDTKPTDPTRPE